MPMLQGRKPWRRRKQGKCAKRSPESCENTPKQRSKENLTAVASGLQQLGGIKSGKAARRHEKYANTFSGIV